MSLSVPPVLHSHADRKCKRLSELQRDSLQTSQTAAHCPGETPDLVTCPPRRSPPSSPVSSVCLPGKDSGGEEAVGSSHQTHHSGKPSRHHPPKGEAALRTVTCTLTATPDSHLSSPGHPTCLSRTVGGARESTHRLHTAKALKPRGVKPTILRLLVNQDHVSFMVVR